MSEKSYTLFNDDCLQVMKGFADNSVDCVITDPPYGIAYQSVWRIDKQDRFAVLKNDGVPCLDWLKESFRITKNNSCLVCFCRWDVQEDFKQAITKSGWSLKSQVVWDRESHGLGDLSAQFAPQHDVIWFAIKGKYTFPYSRPKSVLRFMRISGDSLVHPTQKPINLMSYLVKTLSKPNEIILDPFCGSGTTGVACAIENRKFIGIEIDKEFYKIAESRIRRAHLEDVEIYRSNNSDRVLPLFSEI